MVFANIFANELLSMKSYIKVLESTKRGYIQNLKVSRVTIIYSAYNTPVSFN